MATTPEQRMQEDADFTNAFGEETPAPAVQTEDEAFGLMPEGAEEAMPAEAIDPAATEVISEAAAEGEPVAEEMAEMSAEGGEQVAAADPMADLERERAEMEKERQRLKSWEGRLKAAQSKLGSVPAQTEEPETDAIEQVAQDAGKAGDTELEAAADMAVEAIEDGKMDPAEAMRMLAEDFGDDFVKMIEAIATKIASEAGTKAVGAQMEEMGRTVNEIINDIVDSKEKAHFKAIQSAHPDFADIGASEQFASYIGSLPEAEMAEAQRVVSGGSADEIIALLDAFKAAAGGGEQPAEQPAAEEVAETPAPMMSMDDDGMAAAEGVRGGGLQLPEQPVASSDYEAAWKEFG